MHAMLIPLLLLPVGAASTVTLATEPSDGKATGVANPFYYFCNPTYNYCNSTRPNNSNKFQANLATLSNVLPTKAKASGFASGAFGDAPDTAYGLALCRGDSLGDQCVSCLALGLSLALSTICVGSRNATVYYDRCLFRFSDLDFLFSYDNSADQVVAWNLNSVSGTNSDAFVNLLGRLVNKVALVASAATRRYGTAMARFPPAEATNVLALGQCTQDLTQEQCRQCLAGLITQIPTWFIDAGKARVGGRILGLRCNIRYESNLFFLVTDETVNLTPQLDTNSSSTTTGKGLSIGIGVGSGTSVLLLALGVPFVIRKIKLQKDKKLKQKFFKQNHGLLLQQLISHNTDIGGRMIIDLKDLEKATGNFDRSHVVGGGGHGVVFKGILDLHVVAIKKSKIVVQREINEFINEVAVLSQVNHRNVVKLLGCCLETEVPLLVYEFISNGTLDYHLHAEGQLSLSWDNRLRIAMEVAKAISYLHSSASMPIFHRDIKSSNILLDDALTAKVSDFGASRYIPIDQTGVTTIVQGTIGYLDPMYYYTGRLTDKSDVFSFGVLLIELLTRKKPYVYRSVDNDGLVSHFDSLFTEGKLVDLIDPQVMEEENGEILEVAKLAAMCTKLKGEDRPIMREVEVNLESLLVQKMQVPYNVTSDPIGGVGTTSQDMSIDRDIKEVSRQYTLEEEMLLSASYPR